MRPRARLLRTLGADLISSEKVAVVELVKNAYDADASVVLIKFVDSMEQGAGSIEFWDDGHGMNRAVATQTWFELATTHRRRHRYSETLRRRVLGEKGIGRLAAGRLGRVMTVDTRRAGSEEIHLELDWSDFDDESKFLDDVEITWDARDADVFGTDGEADAVFLEASVDEWNRGHGTAIRLRELSTTWTREMVIDLRTSLSRLLPPTGGRHDLAPDFRVYLEFPEMGLSVSDLAGLVEPPPELERSPYRLTGRIGEGGRGTVEIRIGNGAPAERVHIDLSGRQLLPECGPFEIDLRVWDRDRTSLGDSEGTTRMLLDQASGVSLYRDGFRVFPYGEQGDDWLRLDARRVQNPTLRLSNNQVIGAVFVGLDTNPGLRDQSNREGLMQSGEGEELRRRIVAVINELERRRYEYRPRKTRQKRGGLFERFDISDVRAAVRERHPQDAELLSTVANREAEIQSGVEGVQEVIARYSRLATMSILVDRIVHDGRTAVTKLMHNSRFARRDVARANNCEDGLQVMEDALSKGDAQIDILRTLFRRIEPFGGRRRGRPRPLDLKAVVEDAVDTMRDEAAEHHVSLTVEAESITATVDQSEIAIIVVNLVENAIYWASAHPTAGVVPEVRIGLRRTGPESVVIEISDSGPGVKSDNDKIFDAYYSTRPDGVGLGLVNVLNVVEEFYGGNLALSGEGPLPGATFRATLRKRVTDTTSAQESGEG